MGGHVVWGVSVTATTMEVEAEVGQAQAACSFLVVKLYLTNVPYALPSSEGIHAFVESL